MGWAAAFPLVILAWLYPPLIATSLALMKHPLAWCLVETLHCAVH